jgi:hypothetical protein
MAVGFKRMRRFLRAESVIGMVMGCWLKPAAEGRVLLPFPYVLVFLCSHVLMGQ